MTRAGFPHSEIDGSMCAYHSPSRFAVCCVLLLLCMPRHPPYALLHLITKSVDDCESVRNCFLASIELFFNVYLKYLLLLIFEIYNFSERSCLSICFLLFGFQRTILFEKSFDLSKLNRISSFTQPFFRFLFLLRKEVIHPHVPVGIPCYDLTPIISPTFDGSLPFGLGHRLRVLPTLMV